MVFKGSVSTSQRPDVSMVRGIEGGLGEQPEEGAPRALSQHFYPEGSKGCAPLPGSS